MDGLTWHNRRQGVLCKRYWTTETSRQKKQALNIQLSLSNYLAIACGRISPAMQTMSLVQISRPRASRLARYKILAIFFFCFRITSVAQSTHGKALNKSKGIKANTPKHSSNAQLCVVPVIIKRHIKELLKNPRGEFYYSGWLR